MMRLTEKNIKAVREQTMDGMTYSWFVVMNSNRVSDSRNFINYENGRTVCKAYPVEWLPKAVQNFIQKHSRQEIEHQMMQCKNGEYRIYTYEA